MNPIIVLVGATGHVGRETLIALSKDSRSANFQLKGGVKRVDLKDSMLDTFGFDTVKCDLDDPSSVDLAFNRASKVFLILSNTENRVEQCKTALSALKKSNVDHLVFLSIASCDTNNSIFAKQYKQCEDLIKSSGLKGWTILRSSFFQENLFGFGNQVTAGRLEMSLGTGSIAPISLADVGEVTGNILLSDNSSQYNQKTYELSGSELITGEQMAAVLTKIVAKEVVYAPSSKDHTKQFYLSEGLSEFEANGLADLFESFARNESNVTSKDAESILGHPTQTLETTMFNHKDKFTTIRQINNDKQ